MMLYWLLGFFCLASIYHCNGDTIVQTGVCTGAYCDPSYLPYPNMNAALYGYDISKADPFSTGDVGGDPGWRFPVFMATTGSSLITGAVQLHESIEAKDSLQCLGNVEKTSITNIKEYKEAQLTSSYKGYDLQIGNEIDVEIGVTVPLGDSGAEGQASAATTIPPFMTRSSSNTESESKIKSFFSKEGGSMMKIESTCSVSTVYVIPGVVPLFNIGFVNAVKTLAAASTLSEVSKQFAFKTFIYNYGTHYSQQTTMGSKLVYTMRFTADEKQQDTQTNMQTCSEVQGLKIFGLQVEDNTNNCENKDTYSNSITSEYVNRESYASFGSKPATTLSEWSKQEFNQPMPLKMALVPLPTLFTSENLKEIGKIGSVTIDQKALLDWFLPMWMQMCTVLNIDCAQGTGCGINDDCQWEQVCQPDSSAKGYTCISNIPPTGKQTVCNDIGGSPPADDNRLHYLDRHAVDCGTGTNPILGQFKVAGCGPWMINYQYTCAGGVSSGQCYDVATTCNYQGPGNGQIIYLDRHKIDCSSGGQKQGYFLNKFRMNRCTGSNIQHEYKCCKKSAGDGECRTKQTMLQVAPNIAFLDRHNIDCEGKYLKEIKLVTSERITQGFNEINYKYTCCDGCKANPSQCTAIQSQTEYKQTTCNNGMGTEKRVIYLDRHVLDCGPSVNRWITRFQAADCGNYDFYYDYTCMGNGESNSDCFNTATQCNHIGTGGTNNVYFLDRHKLDCSQGGSKQGYFMTRFHLVNCGGNEVRYDYTCCKKSSNNGACTTKETPKNEMSGLVYFNRHNVDCQGKYLKDFQMLNADAYTKVYYKYTCCDG